MGDILSGAYMVVRDRAACRETAAATAEGSTLTDIIMAEVRSIGVYATAVEA